MRIGIYDPYLDSLSGGEKYMLTAAACLSSKNEVIIFWDDPSITEKAYKKLHIDLSKVMVKPNIFSSKVSFLNKLFETKKFDRLIILSDGSIPMALTKTILHFQHPVEWVKGNDLKTNFKISKIGSVICNSMFTKKFIDKKFNIKSNILYPPCINEKEIENFSSQKLSTKKNNILTVGRYSPLPEGSSSKKLEIMLKVFKQMVDNGLRNWKFVAAISYLQENEKYISSLENTIKNYPIIFIRNSEYSELEKLYDEAKIYWHAAGFGENLEKHPERAEHFGITTVEAMAHKVVPVVIDRGGQQEIVDDNIDGFLWETEEELKQKTKRLMIDDKLREQMAGLALKKVHQFTVEKFCEELKKIIK
jgi:glycosyltransferase involved in cell wall biosynthesis